MLWGLRLFSALLARAALAADWRASPRCFSSHSWHDASPAANKGGKLEGSNSLGSNIDLDGS